MLLGNIAKCQILTHSPFFFTWQQLKGFKGTSIRGNCIPMTKINENHTVKNYIIFCYWIWWLVGHAVSTYAGHLKQVLALYDSHNPSFTPISLCYSLWSQVVPGKHIVLRVIRITVPLLFRWDNNGFWNTWYRYLVRWASCTLASFPFYHHAFDWLNTECP